MQEIVENKEEKLVMKQNRARKLLIFILKIFLLLIMPITVSILDYFFL